MRSDVSTAVGTIDVVVGPEMTATLDGNEIHRVYSTFWLAYHAEVAARRAIEPFFEDNDNAVGRGLQLDHLAMAGIGAHVHITARVSRVDGRHIRCEIKASVLPSETVIAIGTQDQVVLPTQVLAERAANAVVT